jgi:hypothetical protein
MEPENWEYNGMRFTLSGGKSGYELRAGGGWAGANLWPGTAPEEARRKAEALARVIFPAGIKLVGPAVARAGRVGDLKIVGPDVSRPGFIYWDKDSVVS